LALLGVSESLNDNAVCFINENESLGSKEKWARMKVEMQIARGMSAADIISEHDLMDLKNGLMVHQRLVQKSSGEGGKKIRKAMNIR
jgi:hypothetical protein